MTIRIHLERMGLKESSLYCIVVADSRSSRDGRLIEAVGTYNPLKDPVEVVLKEDLVLDWLSEGMQPSDIARNILPKEGVMEKHREAKSVKE